MSDVLEAFIEYITIIKALSKASIDAYRNDLHLIESHYKSSLLQLDEIKIFKYLAQFENKRTLNRKLSSLNAFYDFCHKEFDTPSEDKLSYKFSKVPSILPKYLSFDSIVSSLNSIDKSTWLGRRDYALLLFLYATGLRISECLSIEHGDFQGEQEFQEQWLRVRHTKGDKERMIPVAKEALRAIKAYESECPFESSSLWLNYKGKPLSRISAYKISKKYLNVSPHVLRHSYATALIIGGADLRVVQELLGHASLLTTQVYTHIQKQNLQDTVQNHHPMAH
ncbi:tyrosine-type recombinase/integrase [Sulfurimonas sp. MAG313]|nr:tyrosine-type recombinase/integrase [Sulfurimonas sp. MAG313]MDF1881364.1 tyrosine-type recombinase/integrase [Sulfurimonas sp. MAG313]